MSDRLTHLLEPIPSLHVLERQRMGDARGFLERIYDIDGNDRWFPFDSVAQVNRTVTLGAGTVRGMHFQRQPHAEIKLVHCTRGSVFDVAVDLRKDSTTYLHWHGEVLSPENRRCMRIPEGFAHGFQALEDECELIYVHSQPYRPGVEDGISPVDPRIAIPWPRGVALLSERDAAHPRIDDTFEGVRL